MVNVKNKLERKMHKDVKEEKESGFKIEPSISFQKMKRTSRYLRCRNMFFRMFGLLLEILASYSDYVCYFFMILSMMKNAGLISLIYPFAVFGYALMEEMKP